MKKYCIIDDCGSDIFAEAYESKEAALNVAESEWEHLTTHDKKRRNSYVVVLTEVDEDGEISLDYWELIKKFK